MRIWLALGVLAGATAAQSSSGSKSSSGSNSSPDAKKGDPTPQKSTSNSYFTPEVTYTTPSTTQPFPGKPTAISGQGPSVSTNSYTWTYKKPDELQSGTPNPSLSSALVKSGIDINSTASNLEPDPANLQDARNYAFAVHVPTLVLLTALAAAGAILL